MKVLVSRPLYDAALTLLARCAEVDLVEDREGLPTAQLAARAADCDALLCQLTDPVPEQVLDAAPRLRVVANVAVGHDNIDVAAATARGILVTNTPGVLTETTADFTMALLLAAARRVVEADRYVREGRWRRWEVDLLCGADVHGATLGIVGAGRIGRAVARRAAGFGMTLLHCARHPTPVDGSEQVPLAELLARADFVSLHVPLTDATRHLIGRDQLRAMQRSAILVNTARGPVVDERALIAALERGDIAGAGLDVFEREPEVPAALRALPQVVLAPHLGSASVATRTRMCTMAAENVVAALRGERPPNLVDEAAWSKRRY